MMRIVTVAAPLTAAVFLAGCGVGAVEEVRTIQPTGSEFQQQLAMNYRDLAVYEADEMGDWTDGGIFAQKALALANGQMVEPSHPDDGAFSVPDERRAELLAGYERLTAALRGDAMTRHPVEAATAQAKYDCWLEQSEESWQYDHIAACRDDFILAMQAMEEPAPVPGAPPPVLIFFDWDESQLETEAVPVVDAVAQRLRQMPGAPVSITGFADTSGPTDYNFRLGMRRAETVRDALVARGVSGDRLSVASEGETNLRVPTADGVREPQNRRVRIVTGSGATAQR